MAQSNIKAIFRNTAPAIVVMVAGLLGAFMVYDSYVLDNTAAQFAQIAPAAGGEALPNPYVTETGLESAIENEIENEYVAPLIDTEDVHNESAHSHDESAAAPVDAPVADDALSAEAVEDAVITDDAAAGEASEETVEETVE